MGLIVALTGATGFIGKRLLAAHLERGDRVRVLTRRPRLAAPSVEICVGDLAGGELPRNFLNNVDVLYHCAAELRNEAAMDAVNIGGTQRLLDAAAGHIGRWVQLSSVGVYGPQRSGLVCEDALLQPLNTYERTKAEADVLVISAAAHAGFEWSMLRPSIVFGPDMPNSSLRQLAAMIRRGLFFFIGPPGATANYIYVSNVIDALVLCGTHPKAAGQIFNLSDDSSLESFVASIAKVSGVSTPTLRIPENVVRILALGLSLLPSNPLTLARVDAMTGRASYPADKIRQMLGYSHRITMEDGLMATLAAVGDKGGGG